jgi:hypothetical protein
VGIGHGYRKRSGQWIITLVTDTDMMDKEKRDKE